MNVFATWAVIGAALGAFSLWSVKRAASHSADKNQYEAQTWSLFLFVAALIYVGFALFNGADARWTAIEFGGLAAYSLIAFVAARKWPLLIGPGWLAHALWDQLVHPGGHPGFVPAWYGPACLGFDVVVGLTLMGTLRYRPKGVWAQPRDVASD